MWCVATCVERLSRRQQPPAPPPQAPPEPLPSPPPSPSHATPSAQHPITPSLITSATHPPAQRPPSTPAPNARQWPPARPPKTLAPNHPPRDGVSGWGERSGSGDGGRSACCGLGRLSAGAVGRGAVADGAGRRPATLAAAANHGHFSANRRHASLLAMETNTKQNATHFAARTAKYAGL